MESPAPRITGRSRLLSLTPGWPAVPLAPDPDEICPSQRHVVGSGTIVTSLLLGRKSELPSCCQITLLCSTHWLRPLLLNSILQSIRYVLQLAAFHLAQPPLTFHSARHLLQPAKFLPQAADLYFFDSVSSFLPALELYFYLQSTPSVSQCRSQFQNQSLSPSLLRSSWPSQQQLSNIQRGCQCT